jgi:hypothetical protein
MTTSLARVLSPYARARPRTAASRCDICNAPVACEHRHVLRIEPRGILCSCAPCAMLFRDPNASGGKMRAVPERVILGRPLDDSAWTALGIPVGLAFVAFDSARARWTASYPSPGGIVETELEDVDALPLTRVALPDVEAVLVRRAADSGVVECILAPIDVCYRMVGAVRARWRGMSGGDDVRRAIDEIVAELRERGETAR